jgi:solute carrier family 25 carnitine/acylcarnitine transporter 20/29
VANASTNAPTSSLAIVRQIFAREGLRGLYRGGAVTAVRDSVGYGFYFCAYDASKQIFGGTRNYGGRGEGESLSAWKILMCGGIAGCVSWASIFPLDVVKTRVQSEAIGTPAISGAAASSQHSGGLVSSPAEREPLLGQQRASDANKRTSSTTPPATSTSALSRRGPTSPSTLAITLATYREGGLGIFFRGLGVCSVRAFVVNAVQWAVYEWVMGLLLHGEKTRATVDV